MRDYSRQMYIKSPLVWGSLLAVLLAIILMVLVYIVAPWPYWVRVANVGSQSVSVGWLTNREISGCVVVMEGKGFSTKVRSVCSYSISKTHLITVDGLEENTTYKVMVRQGVRLYPSTLKTVTTYVAKVNPPGQVPGFGTVVDLQGRRIPNALVYVYPAGGGNQYPEATIANSEGNYALDLGFFGPIEEWIVEGGSGVDKWNAEIFSNQAKTPFPPLEVSGYD